MDQLMDTEQARPGCHHFPSCHYSPTVTPPTVTRLRLAISLFFALDGFVFAGWVVRIPAIKEQIHASALRPRAGPAGRVGGLGRHDAAHRQAVPPLRQPSGDGGDRGPAVAVGRPARADAFPLQLGLVLLLFGAAYGGLNVAFNAAAVDLAEAVRRPILPSFHAAFSAGGLAGAGLGGLLAPHLSPLRHLLLLTVTGLVVTTYAGRVLLRTPRLYHRPRPSPQRNGRSTGARPDDGGPHPAVPHDLRADHPVHGVRRGRAGRLGLAASLRGPAHGAGCGSGRLRGVRADDDGVPDGGHLAPGTARRHPRPGRSALFSQPWGCRWQR